MQNVGRGDLHHHRVAHGLGGGHGLVRVFGQRRFGQGHAVGRQNIAGFGVAGRGAAVFPQLVQHLPHLVPVGRQGRHLQRRGVQPVAAAPQRGDGGHGALGHLVVGHVVLGQDFERGPDGHVAHEGGKAGLLVLLRELAQQPRRLGDLGGGLRGEHHQHNAHVGVAQRRFDGQRIAVGRGVAQHVDGVHHAGGGGQRRAEPLLHLGRQRGQVHADALHRVGGHDARAARRW